MLGHNSFDYALIYSAENKTFGLEINYVLPCLKDIFADGHTLFTETTFEPPADTGASPGTSYDILYRLGEGNLTFPSPNTLHLTGGKVIRVRVADGYEIHWDLVYTGGSGRETWVGGLGKTFNDNFGFPITYTANKLVNKSTGEEYTFGACSSTGRSQQNGDDDPNDCAGENRAVNTDDTCGDCLSGYTEDNGNGCVESQSNGDEDEESFPIKYILIGGGALLGLLVLKKIAA